MTFEQADRLLWGVCVIIGLLVVIVLRGKYGD